MQCKEVKKIISRYIDGEMTEELKGSFEAHLKSCPGCQTQCMKIARMWDTLSDLPELKPNAWAFTRLQAQLDQPVVQSVPSLWDRLLIPATSMIMLMTGLWLGSLTWNANNSEVAQKSSEDVWENAYTESIEPVPESSLSSVYFELASLTNGGSDNE